MATSTQNEEDKQHSQEPNFECNICFDTAKDAVVSMCGHLFCWPCIFTWIDSRSNETPTCPVCKSVIDQEKLIPLYGRGSDQQDPRTKVPPRPQGQREEAPEPTQTQGFFGQDAYNGGFNMGGVNISFGMGGLGPLGFGLGPMFTLQTGGGVRHPHQPHVRHHHTPQVRRPQQPGGTPPGQTEEQRKMMARLMLTFAILFIIMILFS